MPKLGSNGLPGLLTGVEGAVLKCAHAGCMRQNQGRVSLMQGGSSLDVSVFVNELTALCPVCASSADGRCCKSITTLVAERDRGWHADGRVVTNMYHNSSGEMRAAGEGQAARHE